MLAKSVCAALSNTSLELESRGPRSRSGSLQGQGAVTPGTARRLAKVDKAAVAFKAVDTNRDGNLDKEEFLNFTSSISPGNRDQLFTKLDKDKNGKIDLEEFRALFKKSNLS